MVERIALTFDGAKENIDDDVIRSDDAIVML